VTDGSIVQISISTDVDDRTLVVSSEGLPNHQNSGLNECFAPADSSEIESKNKHFRIEVVSDRDYEDCLAAATFGGSAMPILRAVTEAAKSGRSVVDNSEALDETMTNLFQDLCVSISKFVQGDDHIQFLREGLIREDRLVEGKITHKTIKVAGPLFCQDRHQGLCHAGCWRRKEGLEHTTQRLRRQILLSQQGVIDDLLHILRFVSVNRKLLGGEETDSSTSKSNTRLESNMARKEEVEMTNQEYAVAKSCFDVLAVLLDGCEANQIHVAHNIKNYWGGWTYFVAYANTHGEAVEVIDVVYNNIELMRGHEVSVNNKDINQVR
jgi:hypothetical protein